MTDIRLVPSPAPNDRLELYLLGRLDEPAREALEAEAFSDPAVALSLDEVETLLVDGYVHGTLDATRREAFARVLAGHARLQTRVAVAQALARLPAAATSAARWWLPLLAVAAVLVIAVSVWVLRRAAPPVPAPTQTASVKDAPADTPQPSVDRTDPSGTDSAPPAIPAPRIRSVFAITLPAGVSRAAAIVDLRVPPGSTHVQLRVPIAPGDDFPRYRIQLRGPDGRDRGVADPAPLAPDRTVWLTVAREALTEGLHEIAVEGLDARGDAEPLTIQQVRVVMDAPHLRVSPAPDARLRPKNLR